MTQPEDIVALDKRIQAAKEKTEGGHKSSQTRLYIGLAFRIIIEFIAPVFVGFCIGYTADDWFGTEPFLTVVMLLCGCVAGVRAMYRAGTDIEKRIKE
ncbi:MAG: AtpZ/AtpI family protein [Alphaproteobacteria bacterium]|nr:AtpZ/AtpI family protein [Alphaproteobacteria bacterium]